MTNDVMSVLVMEKDTFESSFIPDFPIAFDFQWKPFA